MSEHSRNGDRNGDRNATVTRVRASRPVPVNTERDLYFIPSKFSLYGSREAAKK